MSWTHNCEVASVDSCDLDGLEALGGGYDASIRTTKGHV